MVTVAVLGHRGMLGSVVARYMAEQGCEVATTDLRYDGTDAMPVWAAGHDSVINCIVSHEGDPLVNGQLPWHLAAFYARVIQPSTDAIKERTAYGLSKRMGDAAPVVVIRAGLVDIARQPHIAYPEWICNPLTPLEWARLALARLLQQPRVEEHGGPPTDRYSLACMVAAIWGTALPIMGRSDPRPRLVEQTTTRYIRDALVEYRDWLG